MTNQQMVDQLIDGGVLKTPALIAAFRAIDRADFVLDSLRNQAYANYPLPIGYGQTISQPYTVAFILELLQPRADQKILDIGSGSGWPTALLAHVVGPAGHVIALERIKKLADQCLQNLSRYNFIKEGTVEVHAKNAQTGLPEKAPFARIISAAQVLKIPQAWLDQLANNGRLITPQNHSIFVIDKLSDQDYRQKEYPGFAFVPFINN